MPRGFTQQEKDNINQRLISRGRELFSQYGVRKTSVDDLVRAVGISKGAFYQFYESKEALFLEIIERYEEEFRMRIFDNIHMSGGSPRENFKVLLKEAFRTWRENPLLSRFNQEEFDYLVRRFPPEEVQEHFQNDERFISMLLAGWQEQGIKITMDASLVAGLMKALFFVSLHEEQFGVEYQQTLETLINLVADAIIQEP